MFSSFWLRSGNPKDFGSNPILIYSEGKQRKETSTFDCRNILEIEYDTW